MEIIGEDFNKIYQHLLKNLEEHGTESINRKGQTITELFDQKFILNNPMKCFAYCRDMSFEYLEKEFSFYISGSNKLKDAMECSKFWKNCTDDGATINSNYGRLLFHSRNSKGVTQFEYALECLRNNPQSKKAVMVIYDKENAYISNDNPCTMFLRARIDQYNRLHLTVHMRSSDIYFGMPYDVPFFVFVQHALVKWLKCQYSSLQVGTYTHISGSLHKYSRNKEALNEAMIKYDLFPYPQVFVNHYKDLLYKFLPKLYNTLNHNTDKPQKLSEPSKLGLKHKYMKYAWEEANRAKCLKKHVGGVITAKYKTYSDKRISDLALPVEERELIITVAHGGVADEPCTSCKRDNPSDKWYGDECPSVHSEMKLITSCLKGNIDLSRCVIYVTHGPCDACLKFCNYVGIKQVVYDLPYKTNYAHWPNIEVLQLEEYIAKYGESD